MNLPDGKYETITRAADGEGKFIRGTTSKRGQYGHVMLKLEPQKSEGIVVTSEISGESIPLPFIDAVREGILLGLEHGVVAGYPVIRVRVRILDGSWHAGDSSDLAFKMAGIFAVKGALKKANPLLVERGSDRDGDPPPPPPSRA